MTMKERVSLAISWSGAIATSFVSQAHLWVGLACAGLSLVATGYALMVSRATLKLREREYRDRLCADCRAGDVPPQCPFPPECRPTNCPRNRSKPKLP